MKNFHYKVAQSKTFEIKPGENRKIGNVWNYSDVDNLNTDQMFAGKHTYNILSTDPACNYCHCCLRILIRHSAKM